MRPHKRGISIRIKSAITAIIATGLVTAVMSYAILEYREGVNERAERSQKRLFEDAVRLRIGYESLLQRRSEEEIREDLSNLYARPGIHKVLIASDNQKVLYSAQIEDSGKDVADVIPAFQSSESHLIRSLKDMRIYAIAEQYLYVLPVLRFSRTRLVREPIGNIFIVYDENSEKLDYYRSGAQKLIVALLIIGALMTLLYILLHGSITGPFQLLRKNINKMRDGDYALARYKGIISDFQDLHWSFHDMSEAVHSAQLLLLKERALFEVLAKIHQSARSNDSMQEFASALCQRLADGELFVTVEMAMYKLRPNGSHDILFSVTHRPGSKARSGAYFDYLRGVENRVFEQGVEEIRRERQPDHPLFLKNDNEAVYLLPISVKRLPMAGMLVLAGDRIPQTPQARKFFASLRAFLGLVFDSYLREEDRKRYLRTLTEYNLILKEIVRGLSLQQVLDRITASMEKILDLQAKASVLLIVDNRMEVVSARNLPEEYNALIDGVQINPNNAGSCGAAAAIGKSVITLDVFEDPRWAPFREGIRPFGFRSVWSFPVKIGQSEDVVATIAVYLPEVQEPDRVSLAVINRFRNLVSMALEHERQGREIEKLAYYDVLTMLPNRAHLMEKFSLFANHVKQSKKWAALLFLDLDNFKNINDSEGHGMGDRVLVKFADRLNQIIRPPHFIARFGGDEFVIILSDIGKSEEEGIEAVSGVAQRIIEANRSPLVIRNAQFLVTCSIGITFLRDDADEMDRVIKEADVALYRSKENGRNQISFYSDEMQRKLLKNLHIERTIRWALENNSMSLEYQPQVNRQGKVIGAEALLRMRDKGGDLIPPGEFIPIAEKSDLIVRIGDFVNQRASADLVDLSQQGKLPDTFCVSINVSPYQISRADFEASILIPLEKNKVKPERIKLEITEAVFMRDFEAAVKKLTALRGEGFRISLDDFGTGYSSLSYLKDIPVDEIKIDRAFVQNIESSEKDRALLKTIIDYATAMKLDLVIEGVETDRQFSELKKLGAQKFQGYFFHRPLPFSEFLRIL